MRIGGDIRRFASVGSTMDVLDRLAREGAPEGTVVLADEQTAGRGRAGRSWVGGLGGIYCSVLLRPPVRPDALGPLPLIAGVAVAEAIELMAPVRCDLKWPNDVQIDGAKVCGILMQSRLAPGGIDYLNLGIGIDVAQPLEELPPGSTTIGAVSGGPVTIDGVLPPLWNRLEERYRAFVVDGGRAGLEAWRARALYLGEQVAITSDEHEVRGRFIDIGERGQLLLERPDGVTVEVVHGDLTRGPRPVDG